VLRTIIGGVLSAAAKGLIAIYLLALLPAVFLGIVAYADYQNLACPGANQCSDASSVMTLTIVFVSVAPIVWLLFKALRAARIVRAEDRRSSF
jgi:uncharacterized membrane protein